jgi:hypothetical protein
VSVAPCVLVQLIVATPHDAPRDEVFYAAAYCVASRFDGAHRGLVRALLRCCAVWRVVLDESEFQGELCRNATGVVFRQPTLDVSCVNLRIAVLGDSAEGLVWHPSLWAESIWMCTLAEALSSQTNGRSPARHPVAC